MTITNPPSTPSDEPEAIECEHSSIELAPLYSTLYRACCNDCGDTWIVFDEP